MATKVIVQPDEENNNVGKKKKRSKCCTCLIVFAIVSIVIIAAIIGVGWYFGDKYTKQFFGMSLGDTLDVLGDLYWTDDEDVVKRPFKKSDLNGFYNELKENALLRTDVDIDFDAALIDAVNKYFETENKEESESAPSLNATEGADGESGSDSNPVADILVGMLSNVFTSENIDIERLREYDDKTNDTYIFDMQDKQLAAFVNAVLDSMLGNAANNEYLSGVNDYVPLKKTVKLKQIRYVVQARTDEQGNKTKATAADITVWLGLQDAAGYALKRILNDVGFGWAGGFAAWLGDVILPENVYVTVTVPLEDGAEPKLSFNTMNNAERKQMYKLVNGVFKNIMNSDMTVDSLLKTFAEKIKPFLGEATELMDFSGAEKGTIKLDLIGTVAEKISESAFKDDPLTKADIMYTLQALLTTTPEARMKELEPYLYKAWYADAEGKNAVYKYDDSIDVTGKRLIDYGRELIKEIEETYSLSFGDGAALSDVLSMLGISFNGEGSANVDTDALLDKIDKAKLTASLDPSNQIRKLRITDRMLASALSSELDGLLANGGVGLDKISIDLDALTFVGDENYPGHTFALMAVEVGIEDMLSSLGNDAIAGLISGLLPDSILMSMQIDITMSLAAGDAYTPAQFRINDYERTDNVIDTLKKLVPDLDLNNITDQIGGTLRETVQKLDEIIGIELVRSDLTAAPQTSGAMLLPDIYTAVVKTMLTPEDSNVGVVTGEQLRSVLYGLNNTDAFSKYESGEDYIDDTLAEFLADVTDKYYLAPESEITSFDELITFLTDGENEEDFGKKFRVKGTTAGVKYLAYDTRTISEITPMMSAAQLGALIRQEMSEMEGNDINKLFGLLDVAITGKTDTRPATISVTLDVDMGSLVPEAVQNLLTVGTLYVTATVEISPSADGAYPVRFVVNSMTNSDVDNLMKILNHLGGSFDVDEKTEEFGRILYEKLDGLMSVLGNADLLRFVDGGIELASFYEFLSSQLEIASEDPDETSEHWAQTVKNVVQGMFERPVDPITGKDIEGIYPEGVDKSLIKNYRMSDFMFNDPDPDFMFDINDTSLLDGGEWYDKQFNALFREALLGNAEALQTIALAPGDDSESAVKVREWANFKMANSPVEKDAEHIIVSFRMPTHNFSESSKEKTSNIMPDYMCATIALDMVPGEDGNEQFKCIGTVVNNMSVEEYALLVRLMGLSPELEADGKVNLKTMTVDCETNINTLLKLGAIDLNYSDDLNKGIGKIKVTPAFSA